LQLNTNEYVACLYATLSGQYQSRFSFNRPTKSVDRQAAPYILDFWSLVTPLPRMHEQYVKKTATASHATWRGPSPPTLSSSTSAFV
jgi:hypothetical protein